MLEPTRKFIRLVRLPGTAWNGPNMRPVPGGKVGVSLITCRLEPSVKRMKPATGNVAASVEAEVKKKR